MPLNESVSNSSASTSDSSNGGGVVDGVALRAASSLLANGGNNIRSNEFGCFSFKQEQPEENEAVDDVKIDFNNAERKCGQLKFSADCC
jgi:hypothetical protein